MSTKDAFGLAIRIIGLLIEFAAAFYILDGVLLFVDPMYMAKYKPGAVAASYTHYLYFGIVSLVIGLYFLRGGNLIVRFAYGK